ncbi:MAG: ribosome biogenesis GTP-binding protein YihA/YsxC [Mycoplasmataceae bacterium]|nr:ribosome biogenesis GTP-binding protein YihA/YsxC [Mycoplasmataceae bacterium]
MASFIKSAFKESDWILDNIPEFCFLGRSNVGKSTLINALANKKIALTSKTPGRTQLINFYDFDRYRLVDLPGYGFANLGKEKKNTISTMIDDYLLKRKNIRCFFLVCDFNVVTDLDKEMVEWLAKNTKFFFIILNKIDKISNNTLKNHFEKIKNFLKVDENNIILISAKKMLNINSIKKIINSFL